MSSVLIQLLPIILGSMLMPTWVLLEFLLLGDANGRTKALAFLSGVTAVRLLQGIMFGTILNASHAFHRKGLPETVTSSLLLAAGILLWLAAFRQMRRKNDAERQLLSLRSAVGALTPRRALGVGALLVITSLRAWLFMVAALGLIVEANLSSRQGVFTFLLYVICAELLLIAPILASVRSPARFDGWFRWLESHNRAIVIVVSVVVGTYFLWHGASGLLD